MKFITVGKNEYGPSSARFTATADKFEGHGETVGDALNDLDDKIGPPKEMRVIIVQCFEPDEYFTADDQARMRTLIDARNTALAVGSELSPPQLDELHELIDKELLASGQRAQLIASAVGR